MSFKCFYASDIHGSDMLWRKFINAASFYGVEVLIMGGDIAGKAVIPIVRRNTSFYAPGFAGERAFTEVELPALERRIRDLGQYPYRMSEDELATVEHDQGAIDALFQQIISETLERWLRLAEERLRDRGVRLYVMLGNDDEPALREVLAASPIVVDPEDRTIELGEGFQMLSCGFANPTPWHSPREMPEEELQRHIENLADQLRDPA
ncbi:MAG: metallophosphoesterase, partial [Ktedonobacteraceae bacterium]